MILRFLALLGALVPFIPLTAAPESWPIIHRVDDQLREGERQFRFLGYAAPNLQAHEGDLRSDHSNRFPDEFEARDLLASLQAMGSRVTRSFSLSVYNAEDKGAPVYITGRRHYNEDAFRSLDLTLALCREYDVRIIIPFIASQSFPVVRGIPDFARLAGKTDREFWTDAELKEDFRHFLRFVLERRNTVSGILYKDDPAILGWQLGNEFDSFAGDRGLPYADWVGPITDWSLEMAAYIKQLDPNHLVIEAGGDRARLLESPHIDAISVHLYEYWSKQAQRPFWLSKLAREALAEICGRKVLLVDEFGLGTLENIAELVQTIRDEPIAGGLLWSLRCHRRFGGFYLHNEGGTPVDSFHWPGFATGDRYDERPLFELMRREAFAIQGRPVPPLPLPTPVPVLFATPEGLGWRGSTHASGYTLERGPAPQGPWTVVGAGLSDSQVTDPNNPIYDDRPVTLFVDRSAPTDAVRYYRIKGTNSSGETAWSNVVAIALRSAH